MRFNISLNKRILELALPAIFSNITVPLLGLSDTFISGHIGSDMYVAAIAVGTMMVNSTYWLFGFLRAGTTGLTAESVGKNDFPATRRIFTLSFIIGIIIGLALMILSYPLGLLMIRIIDPPSATAALAKAYFYITICAAPALLATWSIVGWMIGMQNTLYPMIISVSVNILNVAMSFLLVFGFETGFYGVALGTLSSNWIGLLLAIILARRLSAINGEKRLWVKISGLLKEVDARRFFGVNADLMLRSACIMASTFAMTAFGGRMGDGTLAINTIVMQLFLFFSYFSDGFAFSAEALCGRLSGAGKWVEFNRVIRYLWFWCGLIAIVFSLIYFFFTPEIAVFLTESEAIRHGVEKLALIVALIPIVSSAAFLYDGIFIGITATKRLLVVTFVAMSLFLTTYFSARAAGVVSPEMLNPVVWGGFILFLTVRGMGLIISLPGVLKRIKLRT